MQLMVLIEVLIMLSTPLVVAIWVPSTPFATAITFFVTAAFTSLFSAAKLMESPFGKRPNDLPLLELHSDFIIRLRLLVDTDVADALAILVQEAATGSDVAVYGTDKFVPWPAQRVLTKRLTRDASQISIALLPGLTPGKRRILSQASYGGVDASISSQPISEVTLLGGPQPVFRHLTSTTPEEDATMTLVLESGTTTTLTTTDATQQQQARLCKCITSQSINTNTEPAVLPVATRRRMDKQNESNTQGQEAVHTDK